MTALAISAPLPHFFDNAGEPLQNGALYFGEVNQNPATHPITVYWDAAATQPAAQPVRTLNGYMARVGTPAVLYSLTDYSLLVLDQNGNQVFYAASAADISNALTLQAQIDAIHDNASGHGADLVGLHLTGTGEVNTMTAPFLNLLVKGLKRNFGAKLDGVTSDKVAWSSACAATGKIIEIEDGTAVLDFVGATPVPACSQIVGWGPSVSVLQFGAAVTSQAIDATAFLKMRDFKMRGSAVAGVGGLYYGKSAIWYGESHNVRVENFKGAGSYGMRLGDAQKCLITHPYLDGNYDNFRMDRTSAAFPTSTELLAMVSVNAQNAGLYIVDADKICVRGGVLDSNAGGAIIIVPRAGGSITGLDIDIRCEDNSATQSTGITDGVSRYQVVIGDGTAIGGATIRGSIRTAFFAPGASAAKSILMNGAAVAGFMLGEIDCPLSQQIVLLNGAYGDLSSNWLPSLDYRTVVYDPSGNDNGPFGPMRGYVPTFSSSAGNYGASFSGSPTITACRYKQSGKSVRVDFDVGLQLIAVTPTYIKLTMPPGLTPQHNTLSVAQIIDNVTGKAGLCTTVASDNTILVRPMDLSSFGSGSPVTLRGSVIGELT